MTNLEQANKLIEEMRFQSAEEIAPAVERIRTMAQQPGADPELTERYGEALWNLCSKQYEQEEQEATVELLRELATEPGADPRLKVHYCRGLEEQLLYQSDDEEQRETLERMGEFACLPGAGDEVVERLMENLAEYCQGYDLESSRMWVECVGKLAGQPGASPRLWESYADVLSTCAAYQDLKDAEATVGQFEELMVRTNASSGVATFYAWSLLNLFERYEGQEASRILDRIHALLHHPAAQFEMGPAFMETLHEKSAQLTPEDRVKIAECEAIMAAQPQLGKPWHG